MKLRELVKITAKFNGTKPVNIAIDLDFASRLRELTEGVNKLLEKAETSNSTDRQLQKQLKILDERVGNITQVLTHASNGTNLTEEDVVAMVENISEAEASINRSRSLLDKAEKLLLKEGIVALNESIHAANTTSKQAVRMAVILNQVRNMFIRTFRTIRTYSFGIVFGAEIVRGQCTGFTVRTPCVGSKDAFVFIVFRRISFQFFCYP